MISTIILTKNEEHDIKKCLDSLTWCDDIHVLDSGSTDKTIEIAHGYDVNISVNAFTSFGSQRNYALDNLNLANNWILFLDADEICTEAFKNELFNAVRKAEADVAGFYCCWKMMLEDKWLKHCDNFPKWQFRVLRKGMARFKDFGHGQKEDVITGRLKYIKEPYLHFGFSKGWTHWLERHNRYSTQEAKARLTEHKPLKDIFSAHTSIRNPALKIWLSKMPGWPCIRFFQAYFLNLGFLEGKPGFIYCVNMAYYEFLIKIKMRELKKDKKTIIKERDSENTSLALKKTN